MKIAITGTGLGLTPNQLQEFKQWIRRRNGDIEELHHGDCNGVDAHVHDIVEKFGVNIIIHPPINGRHRAYKKGTVEREPKMYMERSYEMVDEVDAIIAFPREEEEIIRSIVWATVRYARKRTKRLMVIWPNGNTEVEDI